MECLCFGMLKKLIRPHAKQRKHAINISLENSKTAATKLGSGWKKDGERLQWLCTRCKYHITS
eukprot:1434531-Amphidinium_carterae.1